MPNIKSAKKRVKVNRAKALKNRMSKSYLKTTIKKVDAALADEHRELADIEYRTAAKTIDRAVSKGILHKNTAARRKSRLTRRINALK